MLATDLIVFGLLVTALVFSIIELGLSAYFVSVTHGYVDYPVHDPATDTYGDEFVRLHTPSWLGFLLFCSLWSILVSVALLLLGIIKSLRVNHKVLGLGSLVLTFVTMVFWLAGFAAYAAYAAADGVGYYPGIAGALLAFAILPWLIYLALTLLTALSAFGVIQSDRPGHSKVFGRGTSAGTSSAPQSTPMNTYSTNTATQQAPNTYAQGNTYPTGPTNTYGDGAQYQQTAPTGHYPVNNAMHEPTPTYNHDKA